MEKGSRRFHFTPTAGKEGGQIRKTSAETPDLLLKAIPLRVEQGHFVKNPPAQFETVPITVTAEGRMLDEPVEQDAQSVRLEEARRRILTHEVIFLFCGKTGFGGLNAAFQHGNQFPEITLMR